MRLPRPRFTVRQLMVAAAIIAVATYSGIVVGGLRPMPCGLTLMPDTSTLGTLSNIDSTDLIQWHERMRLKYENAARNPWLPVPRPARNKVSFG